MKDIRHSPSYSLKQLAFYFLNLGTTGFGGPVALVGYMHRDLVDERKWISESEYKEGLALSQLAPGPLAAQLGIYLGYVHYGVLGATVTGLAFVLPSFLMVLGIGWAYKTFGGIPWMQAIFYGVGAAVIGIIAVSSYRLTTKSIGKDFVLWIVFLVAALTTFIYEEEIIWVILGGGIVFFFVKHYNLLPRIKSAGALIFSFFLQVSAPAEESKLFKILWFFTKAGAFVFGSGLAIVPFVYCGGLKEFWWVNQQKIVYYLGVGMINPRPGVSTVGFIGYLVEGFSGACTAAVATFLPCYLFTILPAPYFKRYGKHPGIKAFVDGLTAAAVGAIAGAVLVLGKRTLTDFPTVVLAVITIAVLLRFKQVREPYIILAAAATGLILTQVM